MAWGRDERVDTLYWEDLSSEGLPTEEGTARYVNGDIVAFLDGATRSLTKITINDDSVSQGGAFVLNFVGTGVTATVTTGEATINIPGGGSVPATQVGEVLFSKDGVSFTPEVPIVSCGGWLLNDECTLIVVG